MDAETVKVGGRGQGDEGEETQGRLQKKNTRKMRKGDVLLRIGRRGRRSLSVRVERKKRWMRISMP